MPAVSLIKQVVDAGKLGRIYHYRAKFLQDWTISPDVPQGGAGTWRLDVEAAGSGVTGDLLAHCLDTAIWINGAIASLTAMTETFVKERTHAATGKVQPVGIDDAAAVLARFANGSLGTFESTRYARGHKALYTLEINGEHGSLAWDLHDLNRARLVRPPRRGRACAAGARSSSPTATTPTSASGGCRASSSATSIPSCTPWPTSSPRMDSGTPAGPTFREALETTQVCDAIIASGKTGAWQTL